MTVAILCIASVTLFLNLWDRFRVKKLVKALVCKVFGHDRVTMKTVSDDSSFRLDDDGFFGMCRRCEIEMNDV